MKEGGTSGHEAQLAAVLEALDQAVLLCRPDGLVQQENGAARALAQRLFGVASWIGRRLDQCWGEPHRVRLGECHVLAATGRPTEWEVHVACTDGGTAAYALRWRPVHLAPEQVTGVCVTISDTTLRYTAERTLAVLGRALDAIGEGVVVTDVHQQVVFANRVYRELAQVDEPGSAPLPAFWGVAAEEVVRQAIQQRLATAKPYTTELSGETPAGQPYWHEVAIAPLLDEQGQATHYVGVREDVTARRQMEQSLEESRSRLHAVITTAMDGILSYDEDRRIVMINRAAATMFGLSDEEALGRPVHELIPLLGGAGVAPGASEGPGTRPREMQGVRASGQQFPAEVSISQVHVGGRRIYTAILRDISARRDAERVLQASQRRFKSIFEHSIDGIMLTDDAGNYVDANPAACRLLGYTRQEIVALAVRDVAVPGEHQALPALWQEFLRSGQMQGDLHLRRADGNLVRVEYSGIGNILRGLHLILVRDVTERQALQDQLLRQQRLDSVGRLASGLAHDLNNILTPILMVPGMLRGRLQDPVSLNLLDVLEQGARRGAAIIEQLLTFARERPGERKRQHLGKVAEAAARIVRETFPRNIALDLRVEGEPWPFLGDATQVQQLLLNLAINAKDAMRGGGKLTVAVTNEHVSAEDARLTPGAKPGPYVVLSVVDTGEGIAPENLERIFDPFFTTKPVGEGTGLGLAAAIGIARNHGGFITVRSRPKHGATFRVFLPAVGVESRPAAAPAAVTTPAGQHSGHGKVVLVVDDEDDLRAIARQWLTQHGYAVIGAKDGENALSQLKAADHRVDLVLTDLAMPGMGGDRLITLLRRRNPELRIIVMTGQDDGVDAGARVPAHGFLRKPFAGEDLLQALASVAAQPTQSGGNGGVAP